MSEQIVYKPDYLKLEPKEPMKYVGDKMVYLEHEQFSFGFFSHHFFNSGIKTRWAVLRFDPYSKDLNSGNKYETRQAALNDALILLDLKGFHATTFDLESLVDKIEIPK